MAEPGEVQPGDVRSYVLGDGGQMTVMVHDVEDDIAFVQKLDDDEAEILQVSVSALGPAIA